MTEPRLMTEDRPRAEGLPHGTVATKCWHALEDGRIQCDLCVMGTLRSIALFAEMTWLGSMIRIQRPSKPDLDRCGKPTFQPKGLLCSVLNGNGRGHELATEVLE